MPSALVLAAEAIGIRQITYRQENAGGAMADGYARVSGKVGMMLLAQNGPAATLLVAPLAEAFKASVPLLAIIQEVERPQVHRNAFQELDHIALFQSCAKYVRRVDQCRAGRSTTSMLRLLRRPAAAPDRRYCCCRPTCCASRR
ncbi:MAG: thiamine pyrophosphate-binding protein [Paludibacter sp.]